MQAFEEELVFSRILHNRGRRAEVGNVWTTVADILARTLGHNQESAQAKGFRERAWNLDVFLVARAIDCAT